MKQFEYIKARTVAEACAALARYGDGARILAGGTDLLIEMRRADARSPRAIIDISGIGQLRGITLLKGRISIKPLTTHADLVSSDILRRFASLLSGAASTIGSPQIRNRGTIGGNIMNAATCADTVPPLTALGASVIVQSASGKRRLAIEQFFTEPYRTGAHPDEMLVDIHFPPMPPNGRSAFIKLGRRNALSISRLSVGAIVVRNSGGIITEARIVPGAAFPVWKRILEAEKMLLGEKPSFDLFTAAGKKCSEVMINETGRRWSTEYKEPVVAVLVRRALEQCCASGIATQPRKRSFTS